MTPEAELEPIPFQIPKTVNTPSPPSIKPIIWCFAIFSVRKNIKRNIKVVSGVPALIIPARTDVTRCSAYAKRIPGKTFSRSDTNQSAAQVERSVGSLIPRTLTIKRRAIAPSAHLPKATPTGVRNSRPSFMNINEHPHTKPRAK
ncbi:unannotated protein [freshwater metagenome]|uniref:Unannotated protein n=1 Tax=freshwater metagenome TaxID=449393 RepID=A0A6J6U9K4_9ZZZZ